MENLILFPESDAETHARAETKRKRKLFAWADALLQQLGLAAKVAQAQSVDDLAKITLNLAGVEVALAIRDALHPAAGQRDEHFNGLREGALKRLLQARFDELKKDPRRNYYTDAPVPPATSAHQNISGPTISN
jgi:hypothetical protein